MGRIPPSQRLSQINGNITCQIALGMTNFHSGEKSFFLLLGIMGLQQIPTRKIATVILKGTNPMNKIKTRILSIFLGFAILVALSRVYFENR